MSCLRTVRRTRDVRRATTGQLPGELWCTSSSASSNQSFELPDGNTITVGSERFRCAETLFQPAFAGLELDGVHTTLYNSIMKGDYGLRSELYGNVVLSGGNTLFPGFAARLQHELTVLAPAQFRVKVTATPERRLASWIGASLMASLSSFQSMWVGLDEYNENGPSIVHRKCY